MTTRTVERQRTKCGQYWPDDVNGDPLHVAFSPFVVNLLSEEKVRIGNGIIALVGCFLSNQEYEYSRYTTGDFSQPRGMRRRSGK